ncbi:MAG: energy transducer TonB, partial [Nitrospirales bacterium]
PVHRPGPVVTAAVSNSVEVNPHHPVVQHSEQRARLNHHESPASVNTRSPETKHVVGTRTSRSTSLLRASRSTPYPSQSHSGGYSPELLDFLRNFYELVEEAQRYPTIARELGLEGTTTVKLVLRRNGTASSLQIVSASGHAMLDNAAIETINKVLPLPPPSTIAQAHLVIAVPIRFALR